MEQNVQAATSRNCRNNCGFYGNPQTEQYCSKCYKEIMTKKGDSQVQTKNQIKSPVTHVRSTLPLQIAPSLVDEKLEINNPSAKRRAIRCDHTGCKRRIGLTGTRCRCEKIFCDKHRYPDYHMCTFDYKTFDRQKLAQDNPTIVADKIYKI
eukprot:TRINITY_DN10172_c0_g1_i1.p1 TRINITY_DN10172_c0_g1~~TRINITY_DN10172_c0_g1_i1.p1  ORF type:complete len:151 (+),score=15.09 TRINITY_DN10172_c0_g1_i1:219-671(+)